MWRKRCLEALISIHLGGLVALGLHWWLFQPIPLEEVIRVAPWLNEGEWRPRAEGFVRQCRVEGFPVMLQGIVAGFQGSPPVPPAQVAGWVALLWALIQPRLGEPERAKVIEMLGRTPFDQELPLGGLSRLLEFVEERVPQVKQAPVWKEVTDRFRDRSWLAGLPSLAPSSPTRWTDVPTGQQFCELTTIFRKKGFWSAYQSAITNRGGTWDGGTQPAILARTAFCLWLSEQPGLPARAAENCLAWFFQTCGQIPITLEFLLETVRNLDLRPSPWNRGLALNAFKMQVIPWLARRFHEVPEGEWAGEKARLAPLLDRAGWMPTPSSELKVRPAAAAEIPRRGKETDE